jgi:hypothetical protein
MLIGQSRSWLKTPVARIDLEYQAESYVPILQEMDSIRQNNARASLSWRLTTREKHGIVYNVNSDSNKVQMKKLLKLLE